jgi:ribosomal protein L37AE/L43A
MKHYCGGEIIYIKDEDIWYCQRCGKKHLFLSCFADENKIEEQERIDEYVFNES